MLKKEQVVDIEENKLNVCFRPSFTEDVSEAAEVALAAYVLYVERLILKENYFVFYGTKISKSRAISNDGAIVYKEIRGRNIISIDFKIIDEAVKEIVFVGSIKDYSFNREKKYCPLRNRCLTLKGAKGSDFMVSYSLDDDIKEDVLTAEYGRFFHVDGKWKFQATGIAYHENPDYFSAKYYKGKNEMSSREIIAL